MKIRDSFVSNSSSSSFIIALREKPASLGEFEQMFGLRFEFIPGDENEQLTYAQCVARIFDDLRRCEAIPLVIARQYTKNGGIGDYKDAPQPDEFSCNGNVDYDAYVNAVEEYYLKLFQRWLDKQPQGSKLYMLEYSDNKGCIESCIEHAPFWQFRDSVLVISNH
jgi:hypothetical protein